MCDCDYNRPDFYEARTVVGRKDHCCSECLRVIPNGESHEYVKGLWEGDFSTFRTCELCLRMLTEINLQCYCHGHVIDDVYNDDYPGVQSVADFIHRREVNWIRKYKLEVTKT